uniref:Uncharacterized protein n=1 Tax=Helminthora furcellata TaxID=1884666 RepID=A0A1G4NR44_9FLOR|nr:Hypothetical protein ycf41 [Helminthora furcellata]SCW21128.1 Hypothetical protein ycf41 [Helminthora furcellata]SCW23988.1 Hypothetical protein ycf41 [Helminthora furcellata]
MQTYILTIQMSTVPKQDLHNNISTLFVKVLNTIKGKSYYYIKAIAEGRVGRNITDLYCKGDYIIVESYIKYDANIEANVLVITGEYPIFF